MSEKVLREFYEEDAEKDTEFYRGIKYSPAHIIEISKQVPVRLASESVDLKKLKERLNELSFNAGTKLLHSDYLIALQDIESWAEKEALKNEL